MKALIPGMEPVVGISEVLKEQSSTPAMAASALPMAKVSDMVLLTFCLLYTSHTDGVSLFQEGLLPVI